MIAAGGEAVLDALMDRTFEGSEAVKALPTSVRCNTPSLTHLKMQPNEKLKLSFVTMPGVHHPYEPLKLQQMVILGQPGRA
eukprot:scaffold254799_cov12-Tisochrysis_lutea.AAC.1